MPDKKPNLDAAYALKTPQDNLALYADWAATYDNTFASDMDYRLPQAVASVYAKMGMREGPVLDVGAGTGLLGAAIAMHASPEIDALDLSPEMLRIAAGKGIYRKTIEADLSKPLPIAEGTYAAVLSAGAFTHGHVGPDALDALLRVAMSGASFVLSINAKHFDARGFKAKFATIEPHITNFKTRLVNIYGPGATEDHKQDQACIATFLKR